MKLWCYFLVFYHSPSKRKLYLPCHREVIHGFCLSPPPPEQVHQLLHVGHPAKKLVPFYLGERCYHLLPCVP